jgi:ubiquinone/menaquinone biosynthesis C-methylase UbiE
MAYLREAWRVLKTGGILTCHLNELPQHEQGGTTWDGARVSAAEVTALAGELDCQLPRHGGGAFTPQHEWAADP